MNGRFSSDQLRAVFDVLAEGIISINALGQIISVNPAAQKLFGYHKSELLNSNVSKLMPPPFCDEHDQYLTSYQETGKPKIIGVGREVEGLRKDGSQFPMWLSVTEYYKDGSLYYAGIIHDLSEVKLSQQKALSLENIIEHSINEIYIFSMDSLKYIHANNSALENLQYTLEEMQAKTPVDISARYDEKLFSYLIQPLKNNEKKNIVFTSQYQRKDGSIYPVEVHLEATLFGGQDVFVAIVLDISERVAAEEKQQRDQQKLAHMDRLSMFGEMAAGIAHEINQPLAAISTYTEAGKRRLEQKEIDIDRIKGLFEKIDIAAQQASDVIRHLRMMLRPADREIKPLNINDVICNGLKLANLDQKSKKIEFKLDLADHVPNIVGDIVQLQQVIINLLRNAVDACFARRGCDQTIVIKTTYLENQERVRVSVQDNGCGINGDIADTIFSPFSTTKEDGMGIGLSICKSIINSHNGELWFTQNNEHGVTFHFTLLTELSNNE